MPSTNSELFTQVMIDFDKAMYEEDITIIKGKLYVSDAKEKEEQIKMEVST